jgi:hypothetical protein
MEALLAQIHGSTRLPLLLLQGHEGDGNVHGRASDDHLGVGMGPAALNSER